MVMLRYITEVCFCCSWMSLHVFINLCVLKPYISTKISSCHPSYVKVIMYPQKKIEVHSKVSQLHYFSVISKYKENLLVNLDIKATQILLASSKIS